MNIAVNRHDDPESSLATCLSGRTMLTLTCRAFPGVEVLCSTLLGQSHLALMSWSPLHQILLDLTRYQSIPVFRGVNIVMSRNLGFKSFLHSIDDIESFRKAIECGNMGFQSL